MANLDTTQTPLDQNILARLEQIERADVPDGVASSGPLFPREPASESSVPLVSLAQTEDTIESDQRSFLESHVADISLTAGHRIECLEGDVWISGNSLLCACPDCLAPMTIRAWLRLADCWRCNASISLSEHQMLAVEELTERQPELAQPQGQTTMQTPPPAPPEFPQRPSIRPHASSASQATQSTATLDPPTPQRPAFAIEPADDSSAALPPPPPAPIINEAHDRELERLSRGSFVTRLIRGRR